MEFAGGMQETAAEVANQESWRLEFEKHIEKQYGKHVDVEFHWRKRDRRTHREVDMMQMILDRL